MRTFWILLFFVASVFAVPERNGAERIVGGEVTTIDQHPYIAAMLRLNTLANEFLQSCAGTILNERTILSAAHCYVTEPNPNNWRVRVGSTFRHSGGFVHNVARIFNHPQYDPQGFDHDISVLHLASSIVFNALAQPAQIPAPNYILADNEPIWSSGWGQTSYNGVASDQLKHLQLYVTNQGVCKQIHTSVPITDTMLCFSAYGPGQGTCQQDSGGPNVHRFGNNNVVVGVTAFGVRCGEADQWPDVTMRVTEYFDWILENAYTG
ncbi:trypsin domain-containing protein [Phthorimaea operculella]|nr:trypsin domain-containing protein [Phthorimaea operculella]